MADNFNMKQFLAENKLGAYSRLKEDNVEEVKRYQIGDMWSSDFDYKGMLKAGAALTPNADAKVMQAVSDSFEDVNYHRENSHLQDAIKAKEEGDMDAVKFHLALFKDELVKTIKSIKETQIFERKKVEEGEAAYEYEKGKAAGEKEEKAKLAKEDYAGAEEEKMMDFLAEYEVIYVVENGKCYRINDEGYKDEVNMYYCRMYAGTGVREEKASDGVNENVVNDPRVEEIIQMLKDLDVDGETMEYIIRQIGMDDQMANQLVHNKAELDEMDTEELAERLSSEAIDRMEGLANIQDLTILKSKLQSLIDNWEKEGFEEEDILEYVKYLIKEATYYGLEEAKKPTEEAFGGKNPEGDKLVLRFLQGVAKKFDYPVAKAAMFVKDTIKSLGY